MTKFLEAYLDRLMHWPFLILSALILLSCDNVIKGAIGGGSLLPGDHNTKVGLSTPSVTLQIVEGDKVAFFVLFDKDLSEDCEFEWSILEESTDFKSNSGTVHVSKGSNSMSFYLETINDNVYEPPKNFTIQIAGNQAKSEITAPLKLVDDQTKPSAAVSTSIVTEGEGISVMITLSRPTTEQVSYSYTISGGSATLNVDYNPASTTGTIIIPALTTQISLNIPTTDDSDPESTEDIDINFLNGTNTTTSSLFASPTILDNESATIYAFWKTPQMTVSENAGTVIVEAALNKISASNVQIPFTLSGSAANPTKHNLANGTITIPAGSLTATKSFDLVNDSLPGTSKTVVLNRGTVVNAAWTGSSTDTITITDDDPTPATSMPQDSLTVSENVGTVNVDVNITAASGENISVPYTIINFTTSRIHDHTANSGTLVIPAGSTTGTISIPIVDDARIEDTESLQISLGTPTGSFIQGFKLFTLSILDNDTALPDLNLKSVTNLEGCGAVFVAELSNPSKYPVTFQYATINGTAMAPGDYTAKSGSLTIPPGRKEIGITVPLVDDGSSDSGETFTLSVSNVQNANLGNGVAIGTIKEGTDISATTRILPVPSYSGISSFQLSPDGCFVLAALDLSVDNGIDLYTMDLFGTGLLRVNPEPNDLNGSDNTFDKALITTDSQRIVFNGKYDAQGNRALFSVRPDGQDLIRISGSSLMTAYSSFSLSPNSQQVIYRAAQKDSTTYELFTANVDGSAIYPISDPFTNGGCVASTGLYSPDSAHIIYTDDHSVQGAPELYVSDTQGTGTPLRLNPNLPSGGQVSSFKITPDSQKVIYLANQDSTAVNELYAVNLDGTNLTKLNQTLPANYDVAHFTIAPNSAKIAYYQGNYASGYDGGDIYKVDIDGNNAVKLKTVSDDFYGNFSFLPDSSKLISCGEISSFNDNIEIHALDGTSNIDLSGTAVSWGASCSDYVATSDSLKILYVNDPSSTSGSSELFIENVNNTGLIRLSDGTFVNDFASDVSYLLSPSNDKVIIRETNPGNTGYYLRKINTDGTGAANISLSTASASSFNIDWAHSRVVFTSNQISGTQLEIFVRALP
ncbi:MAG: hypothetical protein IPJ71_01915 [Bdellovibrionales bacterium]|nr:hypothetical protein [Bdellovibrionales bacterium]